jgi:hypothetical protein
MEYSVSWLIFNQHRRKNIYDINNTFCRKIVGGLAQKGKLLLGVLTLQAQK